MSPEERRAIEADCERLIKLYVNLNDAQDWPAVAALYTEDARFARPSKPGDFIHGREAILASFLARPPRAQRHVIAEGETPAMSAGSPLVGTFTDKLVLTADGWRFAERVGGLDFRP
jgi:hypothetical protein